MKKIIVILLSITIYMSIGWYVVNTTRNNPSDPQQRNLIEKFISGPGEHSFQKYTISKESDGALMSIIWAIPIAVISIWWILYLIWQFILWIIIGITSFAKFIFWLIIQGGFYNAFGWWGILGLLVILACVIWWKKIYSFFHMSKKDALKAIGREGDN